MKNARELLLKAAVKLFADNGYMAVSNAQIARVAGVNPSLISYHFGNKRGLYLAALKTQFALLDVAVEKIQKQCHLTPVEKLEQYAVAVMMTHETYPFLMRFMCQELINPSPDFSGVMNICTDNILQFLKNEIEAGIKQGLFRSDLNVVYAVISIASLMSAYYLHREIIGDILPACNKTQHYLQHNLSVCFCGLLSEVV